MVSVLHSVMVEAMSRQLWTDFASDMIASSIGGQRHPGHIAASSVRARCQNSFTTAGAVISTFAGAAAITDNEHEEACRLELCSACVFRCGEDMAGRMLIEA